MTGDQLKDRGCGCQGSQVKVTLSTLDLHENGVEPWVGPAVHEASWGKCIRSVDLQQESTSVCPPPCCHSPPPWHSTYGQGTPQRIGLPVPCSHGSCLGAPIALESSNAEEKDIQETGNTVAVFTLIRIQMKHLKVRMIPTPSKKKSLFLVPVFRLFGHDEEGTSNTDTATLQPFSHFHLCHVISLLVYWLLLNSTTHSWRLYIYYFRKYVIWGTGRKVHLE